jgi:hypothetical protein
LDGIGISAGDKKRTDFDECANRVLAQVRKMNLSKITSAKDVKHLTRSEKYWKIRFTYSINGNSITFGHIVPGDDGFVLHKCAILSAITIFVYNHLDSKYITSVVEKYFQKFVLAIFSIAISERFPNGLSQENNKILIGRVGQRP